MSWVMKSKYFPNSTALLASCKPWDSWMWKSWQGVVNLIKEGCKWQVGNGFSIKVWEDEWLPTPHQPRILSAKPEGCTVVKVKYLMRQEKKGWNQRLLRNLFSETEVAGILSLPLSSLGMQDRLIWKHTPNGSFL